MQGRGLDQRTVIIAAVAIVLVVVGLLIIGGVSGIFGTATEDQAATDAAGTAAAQAAADQAATDQAQAALDAAATEQAQAALDAAATETAAVCPDGSARDEVGDPCNHDEDGDGVADDVDQCPEEGDMGAGVDENGCPLVDTDRDGVPDEDDQCPNEGDAGNGVDDEGCPYAPPSLSAGGSCASGTATFTISNAGGPMASAESFTVTDDGRTVHSGTFQLGAGESATISVSHAYGAISFQSASGLSVALDCPVPVLSVVGTCDNGMASFTITNSGGGMPGPKSFTITGPNGEVLGTGTINLGSGESASAGPVGPVVGRVILRMDDGTGSGSVVCEGETPPTVTVGGVCIAYNAVRFTVTNSGGAMQSAQSYTITDGAGNEVASGTVQLAGGASESFTAEGQPGTFTFTTRGVSATASTGPCAEPPDLAVSGVCMTGTSVEFTVNNSGGGMQNPQSYTITDGAGNEVASGTVQLAGGASESFTAEGQSGTFTFTTEGASGTASTEACAEPELSASGVCKAYNAVEFVVTNSGAVMRNPQGYTITDGEGNEVAGGEVQLGENESVTLVAEGAPGEFTLALGALTATASTGPCAEPVLAASGACNTYTSVEFVVQNTGNPMQTPEAYTITDGEGNEVAGGEVQLGENESVALVAEGAPGEFTLALAGETTTASTETCAMPDLAPSGACKTYISVEFVVTNSGDPMPTPESYTITDGEGNEVVGGEVQLGAGESVTLTAEGQPGVFTLTLAGERATVSTETCAPPPPPPSLEASGVCETFTEAAFTVTNTGGPMPTPGAYTITDGEGNEVAGGEVQLGDGESITLRAEGQPGVFTLTMPGLSVTASTEGCAPPTTQAPALTATGVCVEANAVEFTVTNSGGSMAAAESYTVTDGEGNQVASGTFQLGAGESIALTAEGQPGTFTLTFAGQSATASTEACREYVCGETVEGRNGFPVVKMPPSCEEDEAREVPWTPVPMGELGVCPDWLVYHTDITEDWEVFRLGEYPGKPDADANLTKGVGERVFDVAPSLSPDREWITFHSNRDGNWEIYIARTDGTEQRRVTYNEFAIDFDPVWSPTGQYIAYESIRDGNWNLYMIDVATGVETQLTDDPAYDINPFWAPGGDKLAFQSFRDGFWQIYELNIRTLAVERLSDGVGDDHDPQYSNNGQYIVFRSYRDGDKSVIYYMKADGSEVKRVSDVDGFAINHAWSPDDALIAYQSDLDGDNDIYVYKLASEQTRLVTDNEVEDYAPTWWCNAPVVVFTSVVTGDANIFDTPALPIEADPIIVEEEANQLTFEVSTDQYPGNTPPEEDASREGALPDKAKNR